MALFFLVVVMVVMLVPAEVMLFVAVTVVVMMVLTVLFVVSVALTFVAVVAVVMIFVGSVMVLFVVSMALTFVVCMMKFFHIWCVFLMQRYWKVSATGLQMSQGQRCRRSRAEVSQVSKKRRTCDVLLLLRPICVAGDAKNTDLRQYGPPTATKMPGTCDGTGHHLRRRHPRRSSGATTYTFWALFVHFIAHLVNDSHVFGRFCAFRCPTSGEEALVSKPVAARG